MTKKDAIQEAAATGAAHAVKAVLDKSEANDLAQSLPEDERVTHQYAMRITRLVKGQYSGLSSNAGLVNVVQNDQAWSDTAKHSLVLQYGPGKYEGTARDANGAPIKNAAKWSFTVTREDAIAMGWIPTNPEDGDRTKNGVLLNGPVSPVEEAKQKVMVAKEALELERLQAELDEVKERKRESKRGEDPSVAKAIEDANRRVVDAERKIAEAEKRAELAAKETQHKAEIAKYELEKTKLEDRLTQQQRDFESFKNEMRQQLEKATQPRPNHDNTAKVVDEVLTKATASIAPLATVFGPLVQAVVKKLTADPPPPPPPPPQVDPLAMIEKLKSVIAPPPAPTDPFAQLGTLTKAMRDVKESMQDPPEDDEEILDREFRKMERLKKLTGGSTIKEVGDVVNGGIEALGKAVGAAGILNARRPDPDALKRRAKKEELALARRKQKEEGGAEQAGEQPKTEQGPRDPTPKEWGDLASSMTNAIKKNVPAATVALNLAKKWPSVAATIVAAGSVELVDMGLMQASGEIGRPFGALVAELASTIRSEPGKTWATSLIGELRKLVESLDQEVKKTQEGV